MFARATSKRAGSEARGEGRERGYLYRTTPKPPGSPEGWWDIYLTANYRLKNPAMPHVIKTAAARNGSKVCVLDSYEEFQRLIEANAALPVKRRRNTETIGFATAAEKTAIFSAWGNVYLNPSVELTKLLSTIKRECSAMGVCGR